MQTAHEPQIGPQERRTQSAGGQVSVNRGSPNEDARRRRKGERIAVRSEIANGDARDEEDS
jgi:hypothetical protein